MTAKASFILAICLMATGIKLGAQGNRVSVGFYNLENLFDIYDDPQIQDEEFTPGGEKNWTQDKYEDKLNRLAKVIRALDLELHDSPLAVLGVCEIENRKVLEDLVRHPALRHRAFKIAHLDSRDLRGIDVALVYDPIHFHLLSYTSHAVDLPSVHGAKRITRDVFLVKGMLGKQRLFVTVNHWPSRRGGEHSTVPSRRAAAEVNRRLADSIRGIDPDALFIVMGDLNDNPVDASLREGLCSFFRVHEASDPCFFNPFYANFEKGLGSMAFEDSWGLFDQILLSSNLVKPVHDRRWGYEDHGIFRKPFMMETQGRYRNYPKRSFSGNVYNRGYSDHFPVYCKLKQGP
ncbi:MAG: hypothetical protein IT266_01500 [Saprospiraceae bacterium]|nr:hypothetical protein [Saprospiraceae bacterium]